ncbi:hypothetical protein ACWFR1_32895 [Streptomyces sp. NPDC055103]
MKPAPTFRPGLWREAASLIAWWGMITLALWVVGRMLGTQAPLGPYAASAALMIVVGESGDRVRRRWKSRRQRAAPSPRP